MLWILEVIWFIAAAVSVMLLDRELPMSDNVPACFLIRSTRPLILSIVLLKYKARSPTSSLEVTATVRVRSPSPSEMSWRVSATLTIGAVVLFRVMYIITTAITIAIAAIIIVKSLNWFTSLKMYDFADAIIMDHDLPELPIGKDSIISSTSVFKTGA